MKKAYIKPTVKIIILEVESQVMNSSNFIPESGDEYAGNEAGTNKRRRGRWGDLWSE